MRKIRFWQREGLEETINIPQISYQSIKNRKIMLSQTQVAKFQKYKTSLGVGNISIDDDSRISDYCSEKPDGSVHVRRCKP